MRNFTDLRSDTRTIIPKQQSMLSGFCCRFSDFRLKTKVLSCLVALFSLGMLQAQEYVPLTVSSGFNEDVVANGTGTAESSTTSPVDGTGSGANFAFMSTDFTGAPTTALPTNGIISSVVASTSGLTFQLASYSEDNSLRLAEAGDVGTLTFSDQVSAYRVFVLGTSGNGAGVASGTINFTDGTSQTISNTNIPDWYNATPFAASGFGRVSRTTNTIETPSGNPRLYQAEIAIDAANQTKLIESITVEKVSGGFINVMGVTADVIPDCPSPTDITALVTAATAATITWAVPPTVPTGGYDYYYSTDNTPPTETTTTVNTTATTVELTTLSAGETYYFWVRSNCDATNLGYWQMVSFTTGQIGTGIATSNYFPIYSFYGYNYSQQIYLASEVAGATEPGSTYITTIRFKFLGGVTSSDNFKNWTVYLGNTTQSEFTSNDNWIPFSDLEQAYSGDLTFVANQWVEINLTVPFLWDGTSNLVVAVDENTPGYIGTASWASFDAGANRGILYYSDGTNPDPSSPPTANYGPNANIAQMQIVAIAPPTCLPATEVTVTGLTPTSADLSWASTGALFDIEYGETGFIPTETPSTGYAGITSNSVTITGLTPETHYQYYIRQDCGSGDTSIWIGPFSFFTGYCIPSSTYTGYRINGFSTTDGYTNISNENNGVANVYNNYSNMTVTQSAGNSFNFSISVPGYTLAEVWIDLDQNLEFDPVMELLASFDTYETTNTVFTGSMLIPPGTPNGDYRIRVRSRYYYNTVASPCGAMNYGETEDYTLTVVDVPSCMPPSGLDIDGLTADSVILFWTSTGTDFDVKWGEAGFDVATEGTLEEGFLNGGTLSGLANSTGYEFYVRQDCGVNGVSLWAGPYSFLTLTPGQIGTGTATGNYFPIYSCYGYSYSQQIYLASELSATLEPGNTYVTKIRFKYVTAPTTPANFASWTVYMGNTTQADFENSSSWVSYTDLEQVFSGDLTFTANEWVEINLSAPFLWDGTSNVVVAVDENTPGYSCTASWASFDAGTNRGILYYSDGTNPDPMSPPDANYGPNANIAQIQIVATTPSSCMPPSAVTVTGLTPTSADLSWVSAETGTLFDIEYGETGFIPTETPSTGYAGITNDFTTITGLTPETHYQYYIRQDCGSGNTSIWVGPFTFFTGYCIPSSTYTGYRINGFSTTDGYTNISNENNGVADAYNNYSNMAVTQSAGNSFNFSISVPGYTLAEVWIDLDQNLEFDPVMELLASFDTYETTNTVFTGSMLIPPGTPNGDYRIRVRSRYYYNTVASPCGSMDYGETEDYTLTVVDAPTCLPPSGLVATPLSITSAEFAWTSAGNDFDLEWGEQGFTQGTGTMVTGLTASPYQVTDLTEGTTYSFYVRQDCGVDGESLWAGPISVYVGYCQSVPTSNDGMGITNVTVGATSFAVADVTYYDNTATVADIQAGTTVNSTVTFATGYTYNTNIWIDLNDDGVFDTATELVFQGESTFNNPTTLDTSFLLDAAVPVGEHRMRIGTADAGQAIPNPCYSGAYGVTVDLTVNITAVPSCLPPTALTATALSLSSAEFAWTSTGSNFDLEWGVQGFTQGTGTMVNDITTTSYQVTDLTIGTTYSFYVRQDCGDTEGESMWSGPVSVSIGYCMPATNAGSADFGDYIASFTTTGGITNIDNTSSGYSTGGYGDFTDNYAVSQEAGEDISFTMTPGSTDWSRGLRIWVDWNSNGTFETDEIMFTSAATSSQVQEGTFTVPATATAGDYRMRVTLRYGTTDIGPCDTGFDGEVEDYTVTVVTVDPCAGVTAPTGDAAQSLTLGDTLADLDVTGDDLVWYSDEDLTVEIPETTEAVDGTIYYVVSETDTCQSDALAITVTVIDPCAGVTAPTGATEQSLLLGQTIAGLNVAGNNLVWYSDEDLTVEIPNTTAAVDGTTYYVVSETDTCQSDALAITVTVIDPCAQITTPTGDAEQTLDEGDTLEDLVVNGDNLAWYADADLTISIPATTVAQDGVTYYVASVTDICQSEGLAITVTIAGADPCQGVTVPAPTGDENQTLNDGQTLADLIVEGENLQWYADEDLTEPLEETHVVENETTYYVTQATEDGCTSEAFAVTVTTLSTTDFEVFAFSFYPNPVSEVLQLTSNSEITQINLFNMLGQKVNVFTNANNTQVDMSGLPTGNYIISVTIEGITKTFKVVKN